MWIYPESGAVPSEVGLQTMEEYIRRRWITIADWIMNSPLFATCWEAEQLHGSPCHNFWWEQEFDLELDERYAHSGSDGSTALVTPLAQWPEHGSFLTD